MSLVLDDGFFAAVVVIQTKALIILQTSPVFCFVCIAFLSVILGSTFWQYCLASGVLTTLTLNLELRFAICLKIREAWFSCLCI